MHFSVMNCFLFIAIKNFIFTTLSVISSLFCEFDIILLHLPLQGWQLLMPDIYMLATLTQTLCLQWYSPAFVLCLSPVSFFLALPCSSSFCLPLLWCFSLPFFIYRGLCLISIRLREAWAAFLAFKNPGEICMRKESGVRYAKEIPDILSLILGDLSSFDFFCFSF